MEKQLQDKSPRVTKDHLDLIMLTFPKRMTHIDVLARQWLRVVPWATGWQITDIAGRLVKGGRINRVKRGWYVLAAKEEEPKVNPGITTEEVFRQVLKDVPTVKVVAEKEVHLFTDLQRIESRFERKVEAIWKFIEAAKAQGIEPTRELFDAIYNDTNG